MIVQQFYRSHLTHLSRYHPVEKLKTGKEKEKRKEGKSRGKSARRKKECERKKGFPIKGLSSLKNFHLLLLYFPLYFLTFPFKFSTSF